ncbi:PRD domain-containing protein [Enterococcus sp. LJL99]
MIIKKVLNANAILAEDNAREYILFGKGIGYGKKNGEIVAEEAVNQTFIPLANSEIKEYVNLLESIPSSILEITREIVQHAEEKLEYSLNPSIYFMLSDHLNFAIERQKSGITITNRVFWEIKNYYSAEFELGNFALRLIKKELGIVLPEEEAANIAFHLINAQAAQGAKGDGMNYAKLISAATNIVRYSVGKNIDNKSVHYQRFITHLKFFAERFFSDNLLFEKNDLLFEQIAILYPKATEIAFMVKDHIESIYEKKIPKEEVTYLAVHINRMISAQEIEEAKNN